MTVTEKLIPVQVTVVECITASIKRFTLATLDGRALPTFAGGSHVLVQMQQGIQRFTNAYSLVSAPDDTRHYQIAVQREEPSRGGSAFMHEQVRVGSTLLISAPNNLFALDRRADHHLLIAGGIGITPFLSHLPELAAAKASYALHYAARGEEQAGFYAELQDGPHAAHCHFYLASTGQRLSLQQLMGAQPSGTHVYVCGPRRLIDGVLAAARVLELDSHRVHYERFAQAPASGGEFTLELRRSGHRLQVPEGVSILQAIERANLTQVDCLCREGVCGTCETPILEGEAEHHDQYLSAEEKAAQRSMLICVSRARGSRLVLDLRWSRAEGAVCEYQGRLLDPVIVYLT
ncbi:PDR/VanB family oxidoreductase [Pseudomonas zhanjiangensis]|uniref:Carnitine monooxygenase reductase subunit n=1 Tax=Pseudomonas zhanjiangensis TaxID=3239015 RepID=A0ABV3YYC3_9PSED